MRPGGGFSALYHDSYLLRLGHLGRLDQKQGWLQPDGEGREGWEDRSDSDKICEPFL